MLFCTQKPERLAQRAVNASISGTARRQDWERRLQGYAEGPSGSFFPVASHRSVRGGRRLVEGAALLG
ncbi:MAG: hypothetical protein SNJ60_08650 [Pseudanabaenaceae cyanobacterium]